MSSCRLVQIEVSNFKSFAGDHLIGPFENFTGIIGPNGSGKSNILDSLAFVFYLDKNPRSTAYIHSVIGSERVNECSVRVTLEETKEVKKKTKKENHVYQRVFKINELDEPENIVSIDDKEIDIEKYLEIIGEKGFIPLIFVKQAEVDLIARKTPIELTQLFEEISGSIEYAKEYDELRIESESSHEAVSMIEKRRRAAISEKKHISDRKTEADNFRKLMEEEEKLQIKSSLLQLYHKNKQINEMEKEINDLKQKNFELTEQLNDATEKYKEIEHEKLKTSKDLIKIDEKYKEAEQEIRDTNEKKIKFRERQTTLNEQAKDATKRYEQTKNAGFQLQQDLENYKSKKMEIERTLERDFQPVEDLERQIEEYNTIREQASNQFDDITQDLRRAIKEKNEALSDKNNLDEEYKSTEASMKKKQDYLDQYKESLAKENEKYKKIRNQVGEEEGQKKIKQTENNVDSKTQSDKIQRLHDIEKQCDDIRRIQGTDKRKAKFDKVLTRMSQIVQGVYGLFSEKITPIKPQYEAAAEAGCRGYKDSIIVRDNQAAIDCINFLKEGGYGEARFLPLNNLKPIKIQTKKSVNLLSRLMECEPVLEPALNYVCGHIAVADDIKKARALAFGEKITVVTYDGTIIDPRGIMTGGSTKNKPKFSEKNLEKKLNDLENEKTKLEKEIGSYGDKISKRKTEIEAIEESLLSLRPQLSHRATKIKELENRIKSTETDIRQYKRQLNSLEDKIKNAKKVLKEKEAEVEKVNFTQDKNDQKIFSDFCRRVGVENIKEFEINRLQNFEERYSERLELTSRLSQLNNWIADIESKQNDRTVENYENQKNDYEAKLKEAKSQFEYYSNELQTLTKNLNSIKEEKQRIRDQDTSNRSASNYQRKLCQEITDQLSKNTEETNNAEHKRSAALDKRRSILQQCRLSNIKLPQIENKDEEEITHTPSSATQENIDNTEIENIDFSKLTAADRSMKQEAAEKLAEEYESELEEIRRKIKLIRPDLKSNNRYAQVEEEIVKIEKEQEEKRKKASDMKKRFIDIKEKRKEKFMQLYEKVDQHIDKIYKELTRVKNHSNRSGTAYLSLEDTEEPYLGGIKYTAMPPHKRFRDLEQLSGGEKAVASLALVIALQKFNDSPFILMDEPDASLDKLNLRAASEALSKLSETTQIISVSLRDRFFDHSDALVGVYKDKNIQSSGILTLNLQQFDEQNLNLEELD